MVVELGTDIGTQVVSGCGTGVLQRPVQADADYEDDFDEFDEEDFDDEFDDDFEEEEEDDFDYGNPDLEEDVDDDDSVSTSGGDNFGDSEQ